MSNYSVIIERSDGVKFTESYATTKEDARWLAKRLLREWRNSSHNKTSEKVRYSAHAYIAKEGDVVESFSLAGYGRVRFY